MVGRKRDKSLTGARTCTYVNMGKYNEHQKHNERLSCPILHKHCGEKNLTRERTEIFGIPKYTNI